MMMSFIVREGFKLTHSPFGPITIPFSSASL
jgi:hypothetical protein